MRVDQHRKGDAEFLGVLRDQRHRIARIGVDAENLHALLCILLLQLEQDWYVGVSDRALCPEEDDNQGRPVAEIGQPDQLAGAVREDEVGHPAADYSLARPCRLVRGAPNGEGRQCQQDGEQAHGIRHSVVLK